MNINSKLEEIILLLQEDKFIKSHDIFEELWKEYKNDENTREESFILKAFVNALASLELYNMQRVEHSKNVWKTYLKYEKLIDSVNSQNSNNYNKIKTIIYKKREKQIK